MTAALLDEDGDLTPEFEKCLAIIFGKYCQPPPPPSAPHEVTMDAFLTPVGLDSWARDTNGQPFSQETKEELFELDINEDGHFTFRGFLQLYQLQTSSDEEESYNDLQKHGFTRDLKAIQTA